MMGLRRHPKGSSMAMQDMIESLRGKHASLEATIESEVTRPRPDEVLVHDLKRQKLRIKDEIVRLSTAR
jgi:hypothetical protein